MEAGTKEIDDFFVAHSAWVNWLRTAELSYFDSVQALRKKFEDLHTFSKQLLPFEWKYFQQKLTEYPQVSYAELRKEIDKKEQDRLYEEKGKNGDIPGWMIFEED